jgi:hypothetical protein
LRTLEVYIHPFKERENPRDVHSPNQKVISQSENWIILELFLHPLRKLRFLEVHPGKWRLLAVFTYPVRKVENHQR